MTASASRRAGPSLKARKLLTRLLNAHQKVAEIDGPTTTDGPVLEKQTLAWALEYATARDAMERYLARLESARKAK